jgi:hypothetical protein
MAIREPGTGRFLKGQSGNPAGSRKHDADTIEAKRLAREFSPMAIRKIWHIAEHSKNPLAVLRACEYIADRALGKPAVAIGGSAELPSIRQIVTGVPRRLDALELGRLAQAAESGDATDKDEATIQ